MVGLREPFVTLRCGRDPFEKIKALRGGVFRELETRHTLHSEMTGKSYFLRWHHGTALKETVRSLLLLRMSVLGANREQNVIHRLRDIGADTMYGMIFGGKGTNLLTRTPFIITKDLTPAVSLGDYCAD